MPRRAPVLAVLLLVLLAPPARAEPFWGPDKALHLGVSAGLVLGTAQLAHVLRQGPATELALATTTTLLLGAAKELADLAGLGTPSALDFAWDVIGCALGVLGWLLVHQLFGTLW